MGCILAALNAGYNPKKTPTDNDITKGTIMEKNVMAIAQPAKLETLSAIPIPDTIPSNPPVKERMMDSAKN